MAPTQPPKTLRIGPFVWSVVTSPHIDNFGETTHDDLEIRLNDSKPPDILRETLIHEILHAILFVSGMSDVDKQEKIVGRISPWLFQVLNENPEFIKFLLDP